MIWILLLIISGIMCKEEEELNMNLSFGDISKHKGVYELTDEGYGSSQDEIMNKAAFGDAEHRGSSWYSFRTSDSAYNSAAASGSVSSSGEGTQTEPDSQSSDASSQDTKEKKSATKLYRDCVPCPTDMLKSHKNIGIRWICASYQRARRTFKSECMMRYRNCQDGTMFVKISEHRCKDDPFHGRHWFYIYKV